MDDYNYHKSLHKLDLCTESTSSRTSVLQCLVQPWMVICLVLVLVAKGCDCKKIYVTLVILPVKCLSSQLPWLCTQFSMAHVFPLQ